MAALGRVRISPWLVALMAVSYLLGDGDGLVVSLACVFAHEMGHALCAVTCGAAVEGIEMAPFGGAAHIAGLERMSAGKNALIALAGPAVNVLLGMACVCGAQFMPQGVELWAEGLKSNAVLAAFNMLPAYPMDGGRVLCALLQGKAGYARAQRWTAGLGLIAGIGMMALGIIAIRFGGKVNVTQLICGAYLCMAACKARRETPYTYLQMLLGREGELARRGVMPVRTLAVRQGTAESAVLAQVRPGAVYRVVEMDERMRVRSEKWI